MLILLSLLFYEQTFMAAAPWEDFSVLLRPRLKLFSVDETLHGH